MPCDKLSTSNLITMQSGTTVVESQRYSARGSLLNFCFSAIKDMCIIMRGWTLRDSLGSAAVSGLGTRALIIKVDCACVADAIKILRIPMLVPASPLLLPPSVTLRAVQ